MMICQRVYNICTNTHIAIGINVAEFPFAEICIYNNRGIHMSITEHEWDKFLDNVPEIEKFIYNSQIDKKSIELSNRMTLILDYIYEKKTFTFNNIEKNIHITIMEKTMKNLIYLKNSISCESVLTLHTADEVKEQMKVFKNELLNKQNVWDKDDDIRNFILNSKSYKDKRSHDCELLALFPRKIIEFDLDRYYNEDKHFFSKTHLRKKKKTK